MPYTTILIRTLLAVLMGSVIGIERERRHRPAGFRTHVLVCLGAMSVMVLSEYMFIQYYTLYGVTSDPARLSAQVISGIGFLGAGAILRSGISIKGLTTAASLWVVAIIGLIIGSGFYTLAATVTGVLFIILFLFEKFPKKVLSHKNGSLDLLIELINKPKNLGLVNIFFANKNIKIYHMEFINDHDDQRIADVVMIRVVILNSEVSYEDIYTGLLNIGGVVKVERK